MPKITIEYDGGYPNLCRGNLVVYVDDKRWDFPEFCLSLGCYLWDVEEFPDEFPDELMDDVVNKINEEIPCEHCGGCV